VLDKLVVKHFKSNNSPMIVSARADLSFPNPKSEDCAHLHGTDVRLKEKVAVVMMTSDKSPARTPIPIPLTTE